MNPAERDGRARMKKRMAVLLMTFTGGKKLLKQSIVQMPSYGLRADGSTEDVLEQLTTVQNLSNGP
jgi:hypothetical protein